MPDLILSAKPKSGFVRPRSRPRAGRAERETETPESSPYDSFNAMSQRRVLWDPLQSSRFLISGSSELRLYEWNDQVSFGHSPSPGLASRS